MLHSLPNFEKIGKSMKIWQILTMRLKKYAHLANFEMEIKKYEYLANFDKKTEKV